MTLLQHHILALWLTAISSFALGLLVLSANPHKAINRVVALYTASLAWWGVSESFEISVSDIDAVLAWNLSKFFGACLIAPSFLHSIILFTNDESRWPKYVLKIGYAIGILIIALHCFLPNSVIGAPKPVAYTTYYTPLTALGASAAIAFVVVVNVGFMRLWHALKKASGQRLTQLKYLFWSSVIGYVGGSPDWTLAFGFIIPIMSPFGIYTVPLYSMAMAYAVLRHQLFDVNIVIRRSLIYSLLITALTVGYFGLIFAAERLFSVTLGYQSVGMSLAAFALMALVFHPLKLGIQYVVDLVFFRAPQEDLLHRMERLETEVRNADKLKAISMLAAGMAHEIKNPLASLKTFTSYLKDKGTEPEFQERFQRVVGQEVEKIDHIVRRLLEFARPAPPKFESVRVSQLVDETVELLASEALRRRVEVSRNYCKDTDVIQADPQQLKQVLLNLMLNSLEAMNGSGGKLSVETIHQLSEIRVVIRDTGHGIPKDNLQRIFDPFFTTKASGTGLGLSIVQSILSEHHAQISFESGTERGTVCLLRFKSSSG